MTNTTSTIPESRPFAVQHFSAPVSEQLCVPDRLRLREVDPLVRWLMFSTWGCRCGPRLIWQSSAYSNLPTKFLKVLACTALGLPGLRRSARLRLWRCVNPGIVERTFTGSSCLLRETEDPASVFKLDLQSVFYTPAGQRARLPQIASGYEALREYLGEYLEPTRFEQRDLGSRRPWWVTGAVQRWVDGEVFFPERLNNPAGRRENLHLRGQWRAICAAALQAERETGFLADVPGDANVLIERPPNASSRLVIVDTLPLPASESTLAPRTRSAIAQTRRALAAGLQA